MKTIDAIGIDPQQQVDEEAVLRHAFQGEPLDPEIARRVQARSEKITEQIRRTRGFISDEEFQKIIDDDE